jgi:hypothetical protein
MRLSREFGYALCALLLVLGLTGCSSTTTYTTGSLPRVKEIAVDGKTDDWVGALSIIEDGTVSMGYRNDRENLYVCLMVEDELLQGQIMRGGLTVWFDPQGGKMKSLGIRYPVGMGTPRGEKGEEPRGEKPEEPRGEPGDRPPAEGYQGAVMPALEILRSEKGEPQKIEISEAKGIEIMAVPSRGLFVYELKIPLAQTETSLIALGAQPGQTVGIGFEIPKPERGDMPGPPSGGTSGGGGRPPMGGVPGAGGGRPGGMPGGVPGGGMMGDLPKGLKVWTLVRLSSGDITQPDKLLSKSKILD